MLHLFIETKIDTLVKKDVSNLTWEFLDQRMRFGNNGIEVETCLYSVGEDFLEVWFKVDATHSKDKYDVVFRFYNVEQFVTDDPNKVRYSVLEKMIRNIIHKCDVRMYSSDPSFTMQGCWEGLDANDLSIYKYEGPKGDDIWNSRHMQSGGLTNKNIHLTKHLAQIISQIDSFVPKMVQKLQVAYKGVKK